MKKLIALIALPVLALAFLLKAEAAPPQVVTPPPDECADWCANSTGVYVYPELPECAGVWDMNCVWNVAAAWNSARNACYAEACSACIAEHNLHQATLDNIATNLGNCKAGCASQYPNGGPQYDQCVGQCNLAANTATGSEKTRHDRRMARIGSDLAACLQEATSQFYIDVAGCCH